MVELAIYAFVAAFIFFRLYNSLGRTSGLQPNNHSQPVSILIQEDNNHDYTDIDIESVMESCDDNDKSIMSTIKRKDREFSLKYFMDGSMKAFDIIIKAFNEGNTQILCSLLDKDLYNSFLTEIEYRKNLGQVYEDVIVSIIHHKITKLKLSGNIAHITVKFISEQINFVKDQEGNILQGSTSKINKIEDVWTFKKDMSLLTSKKWYLSSIQPV
ncbi:Tim44/TimA family putative adaptor protein [Ehrlichia ruminantium]|uniref:Tim44-like domain-containing protein n=1 Tax=Ehrlichia ruminantium (strain Welgevonden) TaxID=254945 RepID=A0A0H3M6P2_EHRRW|nr:Tim44/TimA family putative adaptor protein [Ehrlichia ruminantium]KYW92809.1 translocase [Ehrlichia ruminantium]QLK55427.1 Tim44 domain-containing protein [Ehrlichia ruminantium]QLK56343.1 Tim44 domain-containing protein [Ehrlichia ruminantium]QLK58169.1 Tim44 domain-containing protein [Ehrlichia ruminantium]UOD99544.1 Tim44 domain-containing protein [Ehrlichia ruminantium]